jgi:hypothetical protein
MVLGAVVKFLDRWRWLLLGVSDGAMVMVMERRFRLPYDFRGVEAVRLPASLNSFSFLD